jgi:hypothetical protein
MTNTRFLRFAQVIAARRSGDALKRCRRGNATSSRTLLGTGAPSRLAANAVGMPPT